MKSVLIGTACLEDFSFAAKSKQKGKMKMIGQAKKALKALQAKRQMEKGKEAGKKVQKVLQEKEEKVRFR